MVEVKCPLCHSRFDTDGPKAECPDCGEVFFPGGEPPEDKTPEPVVEREPEPRPEPKPEPKVEPRPEPRPEPKPELKVEPKSEPEDQLSTIDKMLSRVPPSPPVRKERKIKRAPARPAPVRRDAPVVAARGRPPAKGPARVGKKPDLAYIPLEFRVPPGSKPPEPEAAKRPVRKAVRPRPKRRVAPAATPVKPITKVKPKRVKRPAARAPPVEEEYEEPEEGGLRPISRRTSELPFWKTRSGLAGILLVIVFVLALAQAMVMLSMDDGPEEGGGRANILGTVVDTGGSKVVGAIVTLDGGEVITTDGSGSFFFESVKTGDHTLTVDASGYGTSTWKTTTSGSNRYVAIVLGENDRTIDDTSDLERKDSTVPMVALFFVICGGVAFVGGVFAFRGMGRTVPTIGAVAGMVSIGLFVGVALALVALILLFFSEKEFAEVFRCAACTGVIGGERSTCYQCGAEYHPACAHGEGECVVCGSALR